ncbi:hypothetical protein [Rhizobium leguminosarum]|uniref:hypothetical protein n=1 Tax=Rhizobium leguminosarum TaxID=384 RepID=UPI001C9461B5|nr:hypothetical protein [Rhizobium leguminosarum]MBY5827105.1 hypothetical protein [Rhizobium leguminosarum]
MLEGGQRPAMIETMPLAVERLKGIKSDLSSWAESDIQFDFNPTGTDLFSIFELAYGYAKRCDDLARSIETLLRDGHVVAATIIGRALIETIAMGIFFIAEMDRLVAHGQIDNLKKRLTAFWGGSKQTDIKPIHVNDALRHFEQVDFTYVRYLDEKYRSFSALLEVLKKAGANPEPLEKTLSAMKNYDFLSEIAHPNGLGVQFIYPHLDGMDEKIKATANKLLDHYRFQAQMSIFQCHHLITALETTKTLAARYRAAFME